MRNIFLDIGGNKGQGLRSFVDMYKIDSSWIIETFEPEILCDIEKNIADLNNLNIKVNKSAVWIYDGTVKFSRYIENSEGGSVNCLMSEGYCSDPNYDGYNVDGHHMGFRKHDNIIEVDCLSLSTILNKFNEDDFIVVKMDVEGSEFEILRKAIDDGTINKINHLYVEWHTNLVKNENQDTVQLLKSKISEKGILLKDWH